MEKGLVVVVVYHEHLSPCYNSSQDCPGQKTSMGLCTKWVDAQCSNIDLDAFLEYFDTGNDNGDLGFQEFILWKQTPPCARFKSEDAAHDIFSVGCILAELYLRRPLFDPTTLTAYNRHGILPAIFRKLPPYVALVVEECIQRDWKRFVDVVQDQKLHLWKSQTTESCFSSLVSAISSCGSGNGQWRKVGSSSTRIAAGLNSRHIRLLDGRTGNVVALWQAHDGFITKLAAPEDHLLVSSSLDKTMRVWDLRRNGSSELHVFNGYSDGVCGFSIWGQDMISVSGNKIDLSSLCDSEEWHQRVIPRKLYISDGGGRNMSALSSINILPFSRLFVVGTEDGFLKICC